jgi:septum formation protein
VRLVLASSSPRRRELLGLLGLTPEVLPADIDESVRSGESAVAYVERLAREKAQAVAALRPDAWVIGADTTVSLGDDVIAKPESIEEAVAMLTRLQGRDHVVHTGMAVAGGGRTVSGVETTRVWVRELDERTIRAYIATGEPMDKAGAYGIQGFGAVIVERIEGDYFTVMGLGLGRLVGLLRDAGLSYDFKASLTFSSTSPTAIRSIRS